MMRKIQDIKLPVGQRPATVLWETWIPDGATQETLVHDRMADHYNALDGVEAVRIVDENEQQLYIWSFSDEVGKRSAEVGRLALAELRRREKQ